MVETSTMSNVWPGHSFSSSDMTKRVWINANSDFLEPTRWLFNVSSGISSERINPVHLSLSLTALDLLWAKQICKIKAQHQNEETTSQVGRADCLPWAWPDPCVFHCNPGDYIIIEQMSIKCDFSFFNISVRIGTLEQFWVCLACVHMCVAVMWCR